MAATQFAHGHLTHLVSIFFHKYTILINLKWFSINVGKVERVVKDILETHKQLTRNTSQVVWRSVMKSSKSAKVRVIKQRVVCSVYQIAGISPGRNYMSRASNDQRRPATPCLCRFKELLRTTITSDVAVTLSHPASISILHPTTRPRLLLITRIMRWYQLVFFCAHTTRSFFLLSVKLLFASCPLRRRRKYGIW